VACRHLALRPRGAVGHGHARVRRAAQGERKRDLQLRGAARVRCSCGCRQLPDRSRSACTAPRQHDTFALALQTSACELCKRVRVARRSNMVALACAAPQLVQVWDCRALPASFQAVMTCSLPPAASSKERVFSIAAVPAPAGALPSQLVLGTSAGKVLLWDLRKPDALWTVAQLSERVLGIAASACGSRVVASTHQGQVRARCRSRVRALLASCCPVLHSAAMSTTVCTWMRPLWRVLCCDAQRSPPLGAQCW
jgi:hypothetical protein